MLNEKQVTDNKRFLKIVEPVLLNKVQSSERINLGEERDSLITNCGEVARELKQYIMLLTSAFLGPSSKK